MNKFKKLLNLHEEATHQKLVKVCKDYGACVYPKVRIADVLPIEGSGIDNDLFRFALQGHFDFVITDTPVQNSLDVGSSNGVGYW